VTESFFSLNTHLKLVANFSIALHHLGMQERPDTLHQNSNDSLSVDVSCFSYSSPDSTPDVGKKEAHITHYTFS
jgi:hypothetical protein